ncbi:MAG: hypothetical protein U0R26_08645 [Solirubrobacterales bacterium]
MKFSNLTRGGRGDARGEWAVAIAILIGIAIALAMVLGIENARAAQGNPQECGDVVVQFKPEGSGGAHAIRATNIGCEPARKIAKSCVKGSVATGWTAVTWNGRVQLTKGDKEIRYTGVGGGGCGHLPESCGDFSYRGVGFFGLEVVGVPCTGGGGGVSTAKAWYDRGGNCSFGHSCELGDFHCKANAHAATVTCAKENGFRVRWQMGE